ncbi:DUF5681 domain-containing protein [Rhodobacteraceae bacterium]|nr:DUF5681 domain-containing protein [Paracoccaceae bacterium]
MSEEEKGYGKPPKKHQFKKGVSGNPRGRPKGKKSFAALFKKLENEKITIQINGKTEKLTIEQAILKRVMIDSVVGKSSSARLYVEIKQTILAMPETEGMSASERNKQDQAILESFLKLLGPDLPDKLEGK